MGAHLPPRVALPVEPEGRLLVEALGRLRDALGEKAMVELAGWVALEHFRSRFNAGLGLRSQGFSDSCAVRPQPADAVAG